MPDNSYAINKNGTVIQHKNGYVDTKYSYIEVRNDVVTKYKNNCTDSCNAACNGCMNNCVTGCGSHCGDGCTGSCVNGCVFSEDGEITCSTCGTACIGSCFSACKDCGGCSGLCNASASGDADTPVEDTSSMSATSKCTGCGGSCIATSSGKVRSMINGR